MSVYEREEVKGGERKDIQNKKKEIKNCLFTDAIVINRENLKEYKKYVNSARSIYTSIVFLYTILTKIKILNVPFTIAPIT